MPRLHLDAHGTVHRDAHSSRKGFVMRLPTPTRGAALFAGAVVMVAVVAPVAFAGGPISASAATAVPTASASDPIVTPVAAAVIPGPIDVDIHGKVQSNVSTVRIDFAPGDTTGWHSHPGPVFVQVVSGQITLRHAAHGQCLSDVVPAGHGFFEKPGAVHVADNDRQDAAVVYATFVLPLGAPPEVSAPVPAACR